MYKCPKTILYYSKRYQKNVTVIEGYRSDGATYAADIWSNSWWVHDKLCDTGTFDDDTPCNNLQASTILHDILISEGRWFRARTWWIATYLFGGGKARKNGMR